MLPMVRVQRSSLARIKVRRVVLVEPLHAEPRDWVVWMMLRAVRAKAEGVVEVAVARAHLGRKLPATSFDLFAGMQFL